MPIDLKTKNTVVLIHTVTSINLVSLLFKASQYNLKIHFGKTYQLINECHLCKLLLENYSLCLKSSKVFSDLIVKALILWSSASTVQVSFRCGRNQRSLGLK